MRQTITITRANVDDMAKGLAASANRLGFRKNGKEMVPSQALLLIAKLKGLNEHTLMQELEKPEQPEGAGDRGLKAERMLGGLVRYLTRNYSDDQWDSSTREYLEEAAALLGWEPFEWALEDADDEDSDELATPALEHSVETAKALLLGKLGYTFSPDVDQPRLWVWRNGNDGCDSSFASLDDALDDVWMSVAGEVMGARNLSDEQWDALSLPKQLTLIEETLLATPEMDTKALKAKWGTEHPWFSREDWGTATALRNTDKGYWDWVAYSIESHGGAVQFCSECGFLNDGGNNGKCQNCSSEEELATNTAEDSHIQEEAAALGINLEDAKFWVTEHFRKDFGSAPQEERINWLHLYRQYNGLTPKGSVRSQKDANRLLADDAFENYDFGDDYTVAGHNGWEWDGESILTKVVFLEDTSNLEVPTTKAIFRVQVENGAVTSILVSGV